MLFTSSAYEGFEIQAAFKHSISKARLQKRVDRLSDQFAEENLCATLQQILALPLGSPFALSSSGINHQEPTNEKNASN